MPDTAPYSNDLYQAPPKWTSFRCGIGKEFCDPVTALCSRVPGFRAGFGRSLPLSLAGPCHAQGRKRRRMEGKKQRMEVGREGEKWEGKEGSGKGRREVGREAGKQEGKDGRSGKKGRREVGRREGGKWEEGKEGSGQGMRR